ncbi:hypothetical protein [Massilibacteroides sp.]|uniref:hypothetical protein n=1 Tax=Massilibacteroides sp. TaxID=2034766 RepID=UPI0026154FC4|nr:hypothetical protein [Massilibacteroides sp.]MDD4514017.1 hypothetical protein [Massilibacteroides sp.]
MKKLMISAIMAFALMTSVSVMAQDNKKKDADTKAKTEACCKKDADKKGDKKDCCKKEGDKKACCSKKEEPKK